MKNIIISLIVLLLIILVAVKYYRIAADKISAQKTADKLLSEQKASKKEYEDSLSFARGQAELQEKANAAHVERIAQLEKQIDDLYAQHQITKRKIRRAGDLTGIDSNYAMLVPNEYVDECETCFNKIKTYKAENKQLQFERDSYDSLMRMQSRISEDRVQELEAEKSEMAKTRIIKCDTTRKLKIGVSGMANNMFLPKGGGFCFIYEDKKFNEYGGHVLFTSAGNIYLLHIAKTISLKRKK